MKTEIECFPCLLKQTINSARLAGLKQKDVRIIMNEVLEHLANFDDKQSAPVMAQLIHKTIREKTKCPDPYKEIKKESNALALTYENDLRKQINDSQDSFETAVRFAIAGNIIDFGAKDNVTKEDIESSFQEAFQKKINRELVKELAEELKNAGKVLVLGDNAGEIVTDKILISEFETEAEITYAVKGSPVINDVTREDAKTVGITKIARVIDNGTDYPGTVLEKCSSEFQKEFKEADVVIAKGQGNFESLSEADRKIYFLFQAKCPVIARLSGAKVKDFIITTTNELQIKGA